MSESVKLGKNINLWSIREKGVNTISSADKERETACNELFLHSKGKINRNFSARQKIIKDYSRKKSP